MSCCLTQQILLLYFYVNAQTSPPPSTSITHVPKYDTLITILFFELVLEFSSLWRPQAKKIVSLGEIFEPPCRFMSNNAVCFSLDWFDFLKETTSKHPWAILSIIFLHMATFHSRIAQSFVFVHPLHSLVGCLGNHDNYSVVCCLFRFYLQAQPVLPPTYTKIHLPKRSMP